jgi:PadR family transcriptional regulator, regulatory protein PadR
VIRSRKLSSQSLAVLGALANRPSDWLYGLELAKLTGLKSGTLYPILIRLADRAMLESRWLEQAEPGRPRRHAYRISAAGLHALGEATRSPVRKVKEAKA